MLAIYRRSEQRHGGAERANHEKTASTGKITPAIEQLPPVRRKDAANQHHQRQFYNPLDFD
jgi:hypothetical protein